MKIKRIVLYTSVPAILIACFIFIYKTDFTSNKRTGNTINTNASQKPIPINENATSETISKKNPVNTPPKEEYNIINPSGKTLATRIRTPEGYRRTKASRNSFSRFLRNYKMKKHGKPVLLYNGSKKANQSAHAAIFTRPSVRPICADAPIVPWICAMFSSFMPLASAYAFSHSHALAPSSWKLPPT